MSFQTDDLSMLTLGLLGDAPPQDSDQPPLPNGAHLRWSPDQERGFPWHGFYLFRRQTRPAQASCLAAELAALSPGPSRSARLDTSLGRLTGGDLLLFTDDFDPVSTVEIDLRSPLRLDLPAGIEATSVDVRIGLRVASMSPRDCIEFQSFDLGTGPSPRTENGVTFDVRTAVAGHFRPRTSIESWDGSPPGLVIPRSMTITLPSPTDRVDLLLTNLEALQITTTPEMSDGPVELQPGDLTQGVLTLVGEGITEIVLSSKSVTAGLIHEFCLEVLAASPSPSPPGSTSVAASPGIEVRALAGTTVVARKLARGAAHQIVAVSLAGAGITAVEIGAGPAALVDLCVLPTSQGSTFGWTRVPGFRYPLCLPVADPGYPCPGKPATRDEAQALAFSRVTYHAPPGWDEGFLDLHDELVALVQGGPAGGSMASRKHPDLQGQSLSPATQAESPKLPDFRPLDLIFLASLQPAFAQMLGLYFVDTSAVAGVGYDYILLADPTGVLGGSFATALRWLTFTPDLTQVDAVLVSDVRVAVRPPVAPPAEARAYALPGAAAREVEDGSLPQVAGSVGLLWKLPPDSAEAMPDQLLFYAVKRASLGPIEPPASQLPDGSAYQPLPALSAILISEPDPQTPPAPPNPRSSEWPPPSIPLLAVDGNLADGWYSYRVSGQTLFGRRSAFGPPAEWFEWDPSPEHRRHPYAVGLLDKAPPPSPLGVEAWALDPLDRWVLMDPPYNAWRHDNPDLVGLRVRWRWTFLQQIQAPDTREFRLYYQPGRWNALLGRTVTVAVVTGQTDQSDVDLDIADSRAVDVFAGARLRVGNSDFAILGSQPGAKLRLRVKNIGAHDEIGPAEGKPCTVAIPETHKLWADAGLAASWAKRLTFVPYDPPARTVFDPSKDLNEQPLTSENDAFKTVQVTVNGEDVFFGAGPNLSGIQPWIDHLWLRSGTASEARPIVRYDDTARTVTLDATPALTGPFDAWKLGRPAREYDVFLPAPDVGPGNPFEPSLEEPAVYAQIAVSAADDKQHELDDLKWHDPARFGNESRLSPSATVFRVLQKLDLVPGLPELGDRLYATPADFHSRSYSTFRFIDPLKPVKVHILRAVDDSLFKRDWRIRETRTALSPANVAHLDYFPDDLDISKRQAATDVLKNLDLEVPYSLSDDAWAVLALLPGNEAQPDRPALEKRDKSIRHTRGGLTTAGGDAVLFPPKWNEATRALAAEGLNGLAAPSDYALLADNAMRILAGLPGNEAVFTQVTLAPLEMADPRIKDERRPDDDADYVSQSINVRAYTDLLAGRATNLYFYRARFVDGAQNQGSLSLAGPPVYLRRVEPLRPPMITKVVGGDRQITIQWVANRESDLAEYRVYRADSDESARDLRKMILVYSGLPTQGGAVEIDHHVEWVDSVLGLTTYTYRMVAVDNGGNVSQLSRSASCRAFDDSHPEPPSWNVPEPGDEPTTLRLSWESPRPDLICLVQWRQAGDANWQVAAGWLPRGIYTLEDRRRQLGIVYDYRLLVQDARGVTNRSFNTLSV